MANDQGDNSVTRLLGDLRDGRKEAADELLPLVYDQLRAIAQQRMSEERNGHTLSATALIHEAYLKLAGPREVAWTGRGHFYVAAAEAMRRILVDHARARAAHIRGGPEARRAALSLESLPDPTSAEENSGFLILHDAMARLEGMDAEAAAVVRLRYFAGLTIDQTAAALGASASRVKRSWAFARGWLKEAIESERV